MANYRIIISKREPNPNFASEMEQYERNNRFGYDPNRPQEQISTDVLITELSEEQFKKVKAEVLKVFE